jgi:hypothetical protein
LVLRIVLDGVLDVCGQIVLSEFPVSNQVGVIIRVVSVHSELFILKLFVAVEFREKLEFFDKPSKGLRLDVVVGTKINGV